MRNHEVYDRHVDDHADRTSESELPDSFFELLDQFVSELGSGSTVLDVGCGIGRDVSVILEEYDGVDQGIGFDLAENMVDRARVMNPSGEYAVADAMSLPFESDSIDGVWCPATLFLLDREEIEVALEEIHRVLTEDGVVMVGFKLEDGQGSEEGYHFRNRFGEEVRYFYFDGDSVLDLVESVGFDCFEWVDLEFGEVVFRDLFLRVE